MVVGKVNRCGESRLREGISVVTLWVVRAREVLSFEGRERVRAWWSDTMSGVTKSAEALHYLMKTRSSWFPARRVGGEATV